MNNINMPMFPSFSVRTSDLSNAVNSIDGFIPYPPNAPQDLQGFPQGNSYHYAPGFKKDLNLNGPQTFNKGLRDGCIDINEASLAANELKYNITEMYPPGDVTHQNLLNFHTLLSVLFAGGRLMPAADLRRDGKLDINVLTYIASADGDASTLSDRDISIVSNLPNKQFLA